MGLPEPRRRELREVVAAVRLPQAALDRLQESLGEEVRLVDITRSTPDAGLVVCPPCSPQTIGALSRQFPKARVVIIEVEDNELGVHARGPVTRSLDAGASAYLVAESIKHLAAMLSEGPEPSDAHRREQRALPAPSVDDEILAALGHLAMQRAAATNEPRDRRRT